MKVNQEKKGDSAVDAWISPDGHFSYVEFRDKQESESALCLSKVKVGGYQLRVSKAKAYAKILVDPSMINDEYNKGLVMSARSNAIFKDIDINKSNTSYDIILLYKVTNNIIFIYIVTNIIPIRYIKSE